MIVYIYEGKKTYEILLDCFCLPHERHNQLAIHHYFLKQMEVLQNDVETLLAMGICVQCLFVTKVVGQVVHAVINWKNLTDKKNYMKAENFK